MSESMINKKLCIIGDGNTGKTCVLHRFINNKFNESYEPTIFENETKICEFDGQKIKLSLWDTAGQETFGCIRVLAYDNTDILLIAFCVMERTSFANVKELWYKEYEKNKKKFSNAKIILVGTKADLRGDASGQPKDEPVTKAEAESLAREINAVGYIETSSKTGEGINEVFELAIKVAMTNKTGKKSFCLIF